MTKNIYTIHVSIYLFTKKDQEIEYISVLPVKSDISSNSIQDKTVFQKLMKNIAMLLNQFNENYKEFLSSLPSLAYMGT